MFINLLPPKTRFKIQFRSNLRRFVLIWSLFGLGIFACTVVQINKLWQTRLQINVLDLRCQPLYALQEEITQDQKELERLQSQFAKLNQLKPSEHFLDLLGVLVQVTRAEMGKLHVQRLAVQSGRSATQSSPAAATTSSVATASPTTTSTLSLNGMAEDDVTLTHFVAALRQAGIFEQVELKASSQVTGGSRAARLYQLECRYEDLP